MKRELRVTTARSLGGGARVGYDTPPPNTLIPHHPITLDAFRYGMTLPTVLALLLVVAFPLAFALYVSTHDYDLTKGGIGAFTGIANYSRTISDEQIGHAVRN